MNKINYVLDFIKSISFLGTAVFNVLIVVMIMFLLEEQEVNFQMKVISIICGFAFIIYPYFNWRYSDENK